MITSSHVSSKNIESTILKLRTFDCIDFKDRWELYPFLYESVEDCLSEIKRSFRESAKNLQITHVEWIKDGTLIQNHNVVWIHFFVHVLCEAGPLHCERANFVKVSHWKPSEKRILTAPPMSEVDFKIFFDGYVNLVPNYWDPFEIKWTIKGKTSLEEEGLTLTITSFYGGREGQLECFFKKAPIGKIIWGPVDENPLHAELIDIIPRVDSLKCLIIEAVLFKETELCKLLNNLLGTPALEKLTIKGQGFNKMHCRLISQILVNVESLKCIDLIDCRIAPEGIALFQKACEIRPTVLFRTSHEPPSHNSTISTFPSFTYRQMIDTRGDVTPFWSEIPLVGYLVARTHSEFCHAMNTHYVRVKIGKVDILEDQVLLHHSVHKILGQIFLNFKNTEYCITKSLYCSENQTKHQIQLEWPDVPEDWKLIHKRAPDLSELCNYLRNNSSVRSLQLYLPNTKDEIWWDLGQCFASMPYLRYLNISGHEFNSANIYALAQGLKEHPSLEVIDCHNNLYSVHCECTGKSVLTLIDCFKNLPRLRAFSLTGLIQETGFIDEKEEVLTGVITKAAFDTYDSILDLVMKKADITLFDFPSWYDPWLKKLGGSDRQALNEKLEQIKNSRQSNLPADQEWNELHLRYIREKEPKRYVDGNFIIAEAPR